MEDFSGTLRHRSQTTSAFTMVKAGTVSNADTDLTKLPQGFSEGEAWVMQSLLGMRARLPRMPPLPRCRVHTTPPAAPHTACPAPLQSLPPTSSLWRLWGRGPLGRCGLHRPPQPPARPPSLCRGVGRVGWAALGFFQRTPPTHPPSLPPCLSASLPPCLTPRAGVAGALLRRPGGCQDPGPCGVRQHDLLHPAPPAHALPQEGGRPHVQAEAPQR